MAEAFFYGTEAPCLGFFNAFFFFAFELIGQSYQTLGGICSAIQQYVFNVFKEFLGNFIVHFNHTGIHNAHIEARFDGVIQEGRVHGFSHSVVAAERETDVRHTA